MNKTAWIAVCGVLAACCSGLRVRADVAPATQAINSLGVALLSRVAAGSENALLSPYSIQIALAMTYAGAEGETRKEMARVLGYPDKEVKLHAAFGDLQKQLEEMTRKTQELARRAEEWGGPSDPVTLTIANRLFGQASYAFRPAFLSLVENAYGAPLQTLDFAVDPAGAAGRINAWVDDKTRQRIRDLVPPDSLTRDTRLVLVNALYLKAPWAQEFNVSATKPLPFYVRGGPAVEVPTMTQEEFFGFDQRAGYSVIALPYSGGELNFLILLPDAVNGLAELEAKMSAALLAECARLTPEKLRLFLPKFRVEPPLMLLSDLLQELGMTRAFDVPEGAADFDRMAPRKPDDYLFISEVFHKTFLDLDEAGTEAAAATAVAMMRAQGAARPQPPREVHVDRPFLFAIQHQPSGACLFIGRMVAPRSDGG